jgi:predicted PolB exonuclease-like 3'-5' exonuclease
VVKKDLSQQMIEEFNIKHPDEDIYERWALMAEFWQIVCISTGYFDEKGEIHMKSYTNKEERLLLEEFCKDMNNFKFWNIIWHNIKNFDIPYICRRLVIHSMSIPSIIFTYGRKPWEMNVVDTMELWQFGIWPKVSLNLISLALWIWSSKQDMDWSDVGAYYEKWLIEEIRKYCEWDVRNTMFIYRHIMESFK